MKKLLSLLVLICVFASAQNTGSPMPYGVRIINTTGVSTGDFERFPVMYGNGQIVDWVKKDSVIQFSKSQKDRILDLIYINGTSTFSVSPSSGERGVSTALTVNYNIISNDDVFGTASINQGIGDVSADIDEGASSASGGSSVVNKSFTLTLNYTRQGVAEEETKSATYTAHIPQWRGVSEETDFTTYAGLNGELTKFVQNSAATSMVISPNDEYIWFISNKPNAVIKDGNGFTQTVGTWGDGVSEFYTKSLLLTLADGTTTSTVYLYRSRNTKTFTNLTYTIQ